MEKAIELKSGGGLLVHDLGPLAPMRDGCILELNLTLEAVRPEARTAVAVSLTELDGSDREYPRGTRILLVPAHHDEGPKDVPVRDVRFILPAELNVGGEAGRRFRVRAERQCIDCPAICELPKS